MSSLSCLKKNAVWLLFIKPLPGRTANSKFSGKCRGKIPIISSFAKLLKPKCAYWALLRCHLCGNFVLCLQILLWWRWVMPSGSRPCFTTLEWEKVSAWPTTSSSTAMQTQTPCSHWRYLTCLLNSYFRHQCCRGTSLSSKKKIK